VQDQFESRKTGEGCPMASRRWRWAALIGNGAPVGIGERLGVSEHG
jgi:hypothetical protein